VNVVKPDQFGGHIDLTGESERHNLYRHLKSWMGRIFLVQIKGESSVGASEGKREKCSYPVGNPEIPVGAGTCGINRQAPSESLREGNNYFLHR
jgi:hypothetical protein